MPDAARKWLKVYEGRFGAYHIRRLLAECERQSAEITDYLKICQNGNNDLRKAHEDRQALVAYVVYERRWGGKLIKPNGHWVKRKKLWQALSEELRSLIDDDPRRA